MGALQILCEGESDASGADKAHGDMSRSTTAHQAWALEVDTLIKSL